VGSKTLLQRNSPIINNAMQVDMYNDNALIMYCVPNSPSRTVEPVLISGLLGRQPTGDASRKPSIRLPLLSDKPTVIFPASMRHRSWLVPVYIIQRTEARV